MKTNEAAALEALAQALAEKALNVPPPARPATTQKRAAQYRWDAITREHCLRRIRTVRDAYKLHWLVDQHVFNVGTVDMLDDQELSVLLRDIEKARECSDQGIPFEDADLIRNVADQLPPCD